VLAPLLVLDHALIFYFGGVGVPNFVDLCRPPARIASVLDAGKGRLGQTVAAVKDRGAGALHIAAFPGRTALCAYLVEELHQDVNAADESGGFPFPFST